MVQEKENLGTSQPNNSQDRFETEMFQQTNKSSGIKQAMKYNFDIL